MSSPWFLIQRPSLSTYGSLEKANLAILAVVHLFASPRDLFTQSPLRAEPPTTGVCTFHSFSTAIRFRYIQSEAIMPHNP
jgi:hypothetical protein